ncbi:MAG: DEAD/DEAH box helicase [Dehalococcoidia bacterium]|nr:DEAD/DEAH box helicase [Dehalococcoidia bacterium]
MTATPTAAAPVAAAITALRADPRLAPNFVAWRTLPPEVARTAPWPAAIDPRIVEALARRGIQTPYTHQAAAIVGALAGRDQVVVTPTASGKTLCYTAPVLQAILDDPQARALYLFPTKALAQDQLNELHAIVTEAELEVRAFTYDGDTSPNARRAVRTAGHVVITNPDMLHTGILPHHTKWVRLFEHLRYIVIDELHTYRGVFGSHVANVLRRLLRICRFYGSEPVFICCSATIANPAELASRLIGRPVDLVNDNGAPRGERTIALYNPPVVNRELGIRRGVVNATVDVASRLQEAGAQTIVFGGSRTRVEELTQYLREARHGARPDAGADLVRGYRSGYLPHERREIEAGLRDGRLRTVVGTNALELGIDIGGLDAAVLAGYPGTLASLWQQMGRAGRRNTPSLAILVASSSPLDQYVVSHPEYLFGESIEAGLIDPDNPIVAVEHVKCAVFELPVEDREHADLGPRTAALIEALDETGMVHRAGDRTYWSSEAFPAEEVSLRAGAEQNVVIVESGPPARVIGEIDRPSAMTLVHDEAIYVHDGRQYHVDYLDWEELKAYVRRVDVDYYTDGHLAVDLKVIGEWDTSASAAAESPEGAPAGGGVVRGHGEVAVTYLATLFKKIRLHTHENIGWGKIRLPQDDLHTSAFWIAFDDIEGAEGIADVDAALQGVGALLRNVAPMLLMCDPRDLHLSTQVRSPHTGLPTIFLWEAIPGGVGFGERLYLETARLIDIARGLVDACACIEGCPGCVGPAAAPGLGVKAAAQSALGALARSLDDVSAPAAPASTAGRAG